MNKLFIDTNIVLDLLAKRQEYVAAAKLFTLADAGKVALFVSSLTIANTHFILAKHEGKDKAVKVLRDLSLIVTILDLSSKMVALALNDPDFRDFEDGLQYHSALESGMEVIITRNLKDFKRAKLPVMTAAQYLKSHG